MPRVKSALDLQGRPLASVDWDSGSKPAAGQIPFAPANPASWSSAPQNAGDALDQLAARDATAVTISEINDVNNASVNITNAAWSDIGLVVWVQSRHSGRVSGALVAWVAAGPSAGILVRVVNLTTGAVLGTATQVAGTTGPVVAALSLPTADAQLAVQGSKAANGQGTNGIIAGCQIEWRR